MKLEPKVGPIPESQTTFAYQARCLDGVWSANIVRVSRMTPKSVWLWSFGYERKCARETAGPNSSVYFPMDQGQEFHDFMNRQLDDSIADLKSDLEKQRELKKMMRGFKARGYVPRKVG